jgi:hypothetical protein
MGRRKRRKVENIFLIAMPSLSEVYSILLEMKETQGRQDQKLDEIISHQKVTNGRVTNLEVQQRNYDRLMGEVIKNQFPVRWAKKHYAKATGIALFVFTLFAFVAKKIDLITILNWIK